jgi:hypothetical protein
MHNTKRTMIIKTSKTCRILAKNKYENEGQFAAKLWLERRYNNNTGDKNRNANRAENTLTVLKCLFEICTTMTC